MRLCRMCLNWRVIGGLAAVSVAVLVVAPGTAFAVVPVLVALACPLSMAAMMWGTGGRREGMSCSPEQPVDHAREERIRRLEAEIASIRLDGHTATSSSDDTESGLALL